MRPSLADHVRVAVLTVAVSAVVTFAVGFVLLALLG